MSKQVNTEDIDNAAFEWLVLMQSANIDETTLQEFDDWLAESSAHREAYLEAEMLEDDLASLSGSEHVAHLRQRQHRGDSIQQAQGWKTIMQCWRSTLRYRFAGGLAVLMFAAVSVWLFQSISIKATNQPVVQEQRVESIRGENLTVRLEDGSKVILGPESEIVFRVEANRRHVALLKGDAFFDVAENTTKPFFVYAGTVAVKVVGTRFDVRRQPSGTSVAVVNGFVQVFDPGMDADSLVDASAVHLIEGQRAQTDPKSEQFQLEVETDLDTSELASWRQGRLIYKRAQLQDILADANRYLASGQILLANDEMLNVEVTLSLSVDELDQLPQLLAQLLPLKVEQFMDDTILVERSD